MLKRRLVLLTAVLAAAAVFSPSMASAATVSPDATSINGCTLGAYYPEVNYGNNVRALGEIYNCNGYHYMDLTACLQQLVSGGWQNVVGSCQRLPQGSGMLYTNALGAQGPQYTATSGRYYRTDAYGAVDGYYAEEYSRSYQGT